MPIRGFKAAAFAPRVVTEHGHLPVVTVAIALEDLDRRRLARAVRPEQREDLAPGDIEVHTVDCVQGAVRLAQPPDEHRRLLRGRAGRGPGPSRNKRRVVNQVVGLVSVPAVSSARLGYRH